MTITTLLKDPLLIIQGVMAAVAAAPRAVALANSAREFVSQMFQEGLVSKEVQDATFQYCESISAAAKAGIIPPSFQVQPDPES